MRLPLGLLAALLLVASARAQPLRYADVRLPLDDGLVARLAEAGVVLDHAAAEKTAAGRVLRTVLSDAELAATRAAGIHAEVLDADLARRAAAQSLAGCPSTPHAITGSMGCYPTFDETVAILGAMHAQYPALVSAPRSIGTTQEGRDLWLVEISAAPGAESGKPEVLYNALHHAREPQSLATVLHFMWTLLDGYGSDPEVTFLLDNRRLLFVPVLNPDGYVYNQSTNPAGGGFWRKNRRPNGGNVFGVDLNRNYSYAWAHDNQGSSPNAGSDTYRGPAAFSEPETAALKAFMEDGRSIRVALNYHAYSNLLIYPWGFEPDLYTPDSAAFVDRSAAMTAVNGYRAGTGNQTVGYLTNGVSDDWMYGDPVGRPATFSWTPEVGSASDNFWPSPDRILPIAEENVRMNLEAAWFAGGRPAPVSVSVAESSNGFPDPGEVLFVTVRLANQGLGALPSVRARLRSANPMLAVGDAFAPVDALAAGAAADVGPFALLLDAAAPLGAAEGLAVEIDLDGTLLTLPLGPITVGTPVSLFASDASSLDGWTATGGWGLGTPFTSAPTAFSDSPFGPYGDNVDARLMLNQPLDLTHAAGARLRFSARWEIEEDYDFAAVEVSTNGTSWSPLTGRFTVSGSGSGVQPLGEPLYEGRSGWVREDLSLDELVGSPSVRLRLRLRSDGSVTEDGFQVDDIEIVRLINGAIVGVEPEAPDEGGVRLGAPAPNPSAGRITIPFTLDQPGEVYLDVLDVLGRHVATLVSGALASGPHLASWQPEAAAPGVYVVRLRVGADVATRRVLVEAR